MLHAVGNLSAALTIAQSPWRATNVSADQFNLALSLALRSAGGPDVPCTAVVPFLAIPGLIISTVIGSIYPRALSIAVETSMPSAHDQQIVGQLPLSPPSTQVQQGNGQSLVSAVALFAGVAGGSNRQVQVQLLGFPLTEERRSSSCMSGTEWRYKQLIPSSDASTNCKCPANSLCSGLTSCTVIPEAGSRWAIVSVATALCIAASTVPESDVGLGLGLGIGLGLPAAIVASCLCYYLFRSAKGRPVIPLVLQEEEETGEVIFEVQSLQTDGEDHEVLQAAAKGAARSESAGSAELAPGRQESEGTNQQPKNVRTTVNEIQGLSEGGASDLAPSVTPSAETTKAAAINSETEGGTPIPEVLGSEEARTKAAGAGAIFKDGAEAGISCEVVFEHEHNVLLTSGGQAFKVPGTPPAADEPAIDQQNKEKRGSLF